MRMVGIRKFDWQTTRNDPTFTERGATRSPHAYKERPLETNRYYGNYAPISSYECHERARAEQQMRQAIALGDLILRAFSKVGAVLKGSGVVLRPRRRDPRSNVISLSAARRR
jgi:hypothetical protein